MPSAVSVENESNTAPMANGPIDSVFDLSFRSGHFRMRQRNRIRFNRQSNLSRSHRLTVRSASLCRRRRSQPVDLVPRRHVTLTLPEGLSCWSQGAGDRVAQTGSSPNLPAQAAKTTRTPPPFTKLNLGERHRY